jgi:serine/threonine-protein kinase
LNGDGLGALVQRTEKLYSIDGASARSGLERPPRSSFSHGAAGVAYFLFRHSQLSDDPRGLAAAAHWVSLAEGDIHSERAFIDPSSRVFPDGRISVASSLYFGEAGIWCIAALVAALQGDLANAERAVDRFQAIAKGCPDNELDAILGAASLLLGTATLVEQLDDPIARSLAPIGEGLAARLTTALEQSIAFEQLEYLGAAHGPCGLVHALLRWCQATDASPSPTVMESLEGLASTRLPSGLWPRRLGHAEVWRGWCHGSAGWVQLWTLAYEMLADTAFLDLTESAAAHAVAAAQDENAGLCCGQAGESYAALALYRATGNEVWLDHARRLADQAHQTQVGPNFPEHSLWRGDLGVALLGLELSHPERAAMPLYRALS